MPNKRIILTLIIAICTTIPLTLYSQNNYATVKLFGAVITKYMGTPGMPGSGEPRFDRFIFEFKLKKPLTNPNYYILTARACDEEDTPIDNILYTLNKIPVTYEKLHNVFHGVLYLDKATMISIGMDGTEDIIFAPKECEVSGKKRKYVSYELEGVAFKLTKTLLNPSPPYSRQ